MRLGLGFMGHMLNCAGFGKLAGKLSWRSDKESSQAAQGISSALTLPLLQLQVALASRPASAWFLSEEQREWLQARQDQEQAHRQAELAKSGKAWGVRSAPSPCQRSPFLG